MRPTKEDAFGIAQAIAAKMFEKEQEIIPVALLFKAPHVVMVIELGMKDERDKDKSADMLREMLAVNPDVVTVVFMAESWRVIKDPDEVEDIFKVRPSLDPKREEGIMISLETADGAAESMWVPIARNPSRLEKAVPMAATMMTGRFCNLFPHAETKH